MRKKVLQTVVLVSLLVVFPLLSWLFLRDGLQYRLDAKARLVIKAELPPDSPACFESKIQILFQDEMDSWNTRIKPVADHFADREEILVFRSVDTLAMGSTRDSLQKAWKNSGLDADFQHAVFLVDTTCSLRMAYDYTADPQMAALAEDIAFLLPLEKEKDFLVKREREK